MAKFLYDKALVAFAKGEIDLLNDTIVCYLIDAADYTVDQNNHEFLSDIPVAARVANFTLGTKTVTGAGVFDAADGVFSNVSGDISEAIVIVKSTGVEATSPLIHYDDEATGLPITPVGTNINVNWNASGIFQL